MTDRKDARRPWWLIGLLVIAAVVEVYAWSAPRSETASFASFRLAAHAGPSGLTATVAAGLIVGSLWWWLTKHFSHRLRWAKGLVAGRTGWVALGGAALLIHLFFFDIAQGQPDTVDYFLYAQHVVRAPVETLIHWKEIVWDVPQGRFHHHMPWVPTVYAAAFALLGETSTTMDLVLTAIAVALPLATAWVGTVSGAPRAGMVAGWLTLAIPFLAAQSGWFLVDLPLALMCCLVWGTSVKWLDGGRIWPLAIALTLCLMTKISAPLFVAGPVLALWLGRRISRPRVVLATLFGLAVGAMFLLWMVHPPRLREDPMTWFNALWSLGLHLRPTVWLAACACLCLKSPLQRISVGAVLCIPVLVAYAPAEHVARYAMPLAPALALGAASVLRRLDSWVAGILASGLVLLMVAYRPVVVHTQAKNLQVAARALEKAGVSEIEVWADQPKTTFPVAALTALVDLYVDIPVRIGGQLGLGDPDHKQHWWEHLEPPIWHQASDAPPATGSLLCLLGGDEKLYEANPGKDRIRLQQVEEYRHSSFLLPDRVIIYGPTPHNPIQSIE